MAVAEARHHFSKGQTTASIREVEEQVKNNAPRRQKAPPPGMRPASLAEPQETQVVFERHVAQQVHDAPVVPILAAPVPHMVDQLDVLKILGMQLPVLPEQVVSVPKISSPSRCSSTVLSAPQMVEQLMEVPTIQQWTAEQLVTILLSRGRLGCLPGSISGQASTAFVAEQTADIPSSSGGLPGFRPRQHSTARFEEQNVDIPVPRGRRGGGGGLHDLRPGQGSAAFSGAEHGHDAPRRSRRGGGSVGGPEGFVPGQDSAARGRAVCWTPLPPAWTQRLWLHRLRRGGRVRRCGGLVGFESPSRGRGTSPQMRP